MDTELGIDAVGNLNQACDLMNEAIEMMREGSFQGCGKVQNAVREAEKAIAILAEALRKAGAI